MKSFRNVIHVAIAVIVLSLAGIQTANATTARRNSLSGNRLIEDREDVFLYPQLAVNYANLVGFDYAPSPDPNNMQGDGLLIMGNERGAFGIALHRGDLFDNGLFPYANGNGALAGAQGPLAGQLIPAGTIVDVFGGVDLGGGVLGARLALGNGSTSQEPAQGDASSTSQTFVLLQVGYSMAGPVVLDTSLKFGFATGSQEQGDNTPLDGSDIFLDLGARGYADIGQPFELGFLGGIAFNSQSLDTTVADTTTTSSNSSFGIEAGAGPVWEVGGEDNDTTIAAYGVLGYRSSSSDPDTDNDNDATGNSAVILPGFNVAADIQVLDWLYFRSGAQYAWAINGTSQETPDGENTTSNHGAGFGWNAGLGVEAGNFRFDGTLSNNFLLNGPNFIGGGTGFLTTASAQYTWE